MRLQERVSEDIQRVLEGDVDTLEREVRHQLSGAGEM